MHFAKLSLVSGNRILTFDTFRHDFDNSDNKNTDIWLQTIDIEESVVAPRSRISPILSPDLLSSTFTKCLYNSYYYPMGNHPSP
jgi:N-acyl-L-homoserine lactone synthetase